MTVASHMPGISPQISQPNKLRNNMISMIGREGETALTSAAAIANDADEPETHRIARRRGCLPPSVILRD